MIEKKVFSSDYYMIISNEPTSWLDRMSFIASNDSSHLLSKNYKKICYEMFAFYVIVVNNDVPAFFYGTEKPSWTPPNIGRAYHKMFKHPLYRDRSKFLEFAPWIKRAVDYNEMQEWTDLYGIDGLIVTRNVNTKKDATRYILDLQWQKYPYTCNIRSKEQWVYYRGNIDLGFLKPFHA